MDYKAIFDPSKQRGEDEIIPPEPPGDEARPSQYVYDDQIVLAINLALAAGRPLLVSGDPGTGKTSLAKSTAFTLGWRFYTHVVTSSSEARDLKWKLDAVQRIGDAQANRLPEVDSITPYIQPGPLWWALDCADASKRGTSKPPDDLVLTDPSEFNRGAANAVVLVDEIDKADPDVPNDLLEVLGSRHFKVSDTDHVVRGQNVPLIILTTNQERDLPGAFVRRCVRLALPPVTAKSLENVGFKHFGKRGMTGVVRAAAKETMRLRTEAKKLDVRQPSTAEFLDLLWVCKNIEVQPDHRDWKTVSLATLWKTESGEDEESESEG